MIVVTLRCLCGMEAAARLSRETSYVLTNSEFTAGDCRGCGLVNHELSESYVISSTWRSMYLKSPDGRCQTA